MKKRSRGQSGYSPPSASPKTYSKEKSLNMITNRHANYAAAGVVPYTIHNNQLLVLMGKEYRKKSNIATWCEFGGKREKSGSHKETRPIETFVREFCEETCALFVQQPTACPATKKELEKRFQLAKEYIEHLLTNSKSTHFSYIGAGRYWVCLCPVPYVDTALYNKLSAANQRFDHVITDSDKLKVDWIPFEELTLTALKDSNLQGSGLHPFFKNHVYTAVFEALANISLRLKYHMLSSEEFLRDGLLLSVEAEDEEDEEECWNLDSLLPEPKRMRIK